jgi:hypothetical protein
VEGLVVVVQVVTVALSAPFREFRHLIHEGLQTRDFLRVAA